ncbi:hypothetical protein D3C84_1042400 [compost metagenome]
MTRQALVAVDVDLITANAVGDGRRLFRVVAFALEVLVFFVGDGRGRHALGQGATWPAPVRPGGIERVVDVCSHHHADRSEQEQRQDSKRHDGSPQATLINSIRIAHFL